MQREISDDLVGRDENVVQYKVLDWGGEKEVKRGERRFDSAVRRGSFGEGKGVVRQKALDVFSCLCVVLARLRGPSLREDAAVRWR